MTLHHFKIVKKIEKNFLFFFKLGKFLDVGKPKIHFSS